VAWHAWRMTDADRWAGVVGPPTSKAQAQARQRQQASQARFEHALGVVNQAAAAVSAGAQARLDRLVGSLDELAFDDFEQHHPGHAALDFALYDVVCDLADDDEDAGFGQTWVDRLVTHADHELAGAGARWVRLAVGFAADEYQLSNQEREAVDRYRGELRPDHDTNLVTYLASRDQRSPAAHLRDGIHALAWLRDHA
jgi:hypothetical protein